MSWQVIVDDAVTGGLKLYTETQDLPTDVPLDGIVHLIVDDAIQQGYERYFWKDDVDGGFWGFNNDTEEKIKLDYGVDAHVARGRTTTTDNWYASKKFALLHAGHTIEPVINPNGTETFTLPTGAATLPPSPVSLIGWKVWTSKEMIASTGIAEADWAAHWANNVPDDVQHITTYINWPVGRNGLGRHNIGAQDFYLFSPHPSGKPLIHGSDDLDLDARYGGSKKTGKFINPTKLRQIMAEAAADWTI